MRGLVDPKLFLVNFAKWQKRVSGATQYAGEIILNDVSKSRWALICVISLPPESLFTFPISGLGISKS